MVQLSGFLCRPSEFLKFLICSCNKEPQGIVLLAIQASVLYGVSVGVGFGVQGEGGF